MYEFKILLLDFVSLQLGALTRYDAPTLIVYLRLVIVKQSYSYLCQSMTASVTALVNTQILRIQDSLRS